MDDDANTTSVVDSALFADLFKAARRGALSTETEAPPPEPPDWPTDDPDRATAAVEPGLPRPQGVAAVRGEPARTGWRGGLVRTTAGLLRLRPGKAEQRMRAARAVLRSAVDRPLTVVFAHPDAAARECGVTLRTAHTFGMARGGSVLAWSVGPGPVGVPAAQEPPVAALTDPAALRGGRTRLTDLARFTQPQPTGVDVLPGDDTVATPSWFADAHAVLSRFYSVLCVEVGDGPRTWADVADVLVLCATTTTDSVDAVLDLAADLRAAGHAHLVDNAIGVLAAKDKAPKVVLRMLGERLRGELAPVHVVGRRRDADLVTRGPAPDAPVWTFLGASIVDSSTTRDLDKGDRPASQR